MNNINPFEVMKAEKRLKQQKGKQALLYRLQQHKSYYDKELYHEKFVFCDADSVIAVDVSITNTALILRIEMVSSR